MTQRIFSLVFLFFILFNVQTSFAQDELTLDDSFAADPAPTDSGMLGEELSLENSFDNPNDVILDSENPNPMDTFVDSPNTSLSEDPYASAAATQPMGPAENVNLASAVELRQREGALYGLSVGAIFSSASFNEDYDRGNLSQGQVVSTERLRQSTDSVQNMGMMARYAITPYYNLGIDLNISYSKSLNHSSITVNNVNSLEEVTTIKGELNFAYAILVGDTPMYFLAGLGAQRVTGDQIKKIIKPLGYGGQIGGGFVIGSKFNIEAMYSYYLHRVSDYLVQETIKASPPRLIYESARIANQGLIVRGTYNFDY